MSETRILIGLLRMYFPRNREFIIIIIIIKIIFIICNWVFTRWQWIIYMYTIYIIATKFTSGGLHGKHVVAIWNFENHLRICYWDGSQNLAGLCQNFGISGVGGLNPSNNPPRYATDQHKSVTSVTLRLNFPTRCQFSYFPIKMRVKTQHISNHLLQSFTKYSKINC
jgi:hypothetical protein